MEGEGKGGPEKQMVCLGKGKSKEIGRGICDQEL